MKYLPTPHNDAVLRSAWYLSLMIRISPRSCERIFRDKLDHRPWLLDTPHPATVTPILALAQTEHWSRVDRWWCSQPARRAERVDRLWRPDEDQVNGDLPDDLRSDQPSRVPIRIVHAASDLREIPAKVIWCLKRLGYVDPGKRGSGRAVTRALKVSA